MTLEQASDLIRANELLRSIHQRQPTRTATASQSRSKDNIDTGTSAV